VLEEHGLAAALQSMVQGALLDEGPKIMLEIAETVPSLPSGTDFHLLRIAQEALANAMKHAQAKNIVISLRDLDSSLVLSIQDDGIGFASKSQDTLMTAHFGMLGMQNRVEKIGASLDIYSSPGNGCQVTIKLPLKNPNESP
jgi:signal transduction histidine kinase